ncbi:hypothetical protein ACS0TY_001515 [Phlomoides rotata]
MAAAAYHVEEEHLWKCPKHPSKRRRNGGICPACLRDRLDNLCTNCGNVRPCPCVSSSSSSSCSSSSLGGEQPFRRSRSIAIPFLRSNTGGRVNTLSFLSAFRRSKSKMGEENKDGRNSFNGEDDRVESNEKIENFARMITRSRSVSVGTTSSGFISSSSAAKFWLFPNAFHRSKNPKVIAQDRSPLHRGEE